MAADYAVITKTNRPQMGSEAIALANLLRDVCDRIDALNDAGQHMFNGGDYSLMEQQFGLAGGTGANFLTMLANLNTIFNTDTDVTGANRLSQIQEYVSRVAGQ